MSTTIRVNITRTSDNEPLLKLNGGPFINFQLTPHQAHMLAATLGGLADAIDGEDVSAPDWQPRAFVLHDVLGGEAPPVKHSQSWEWGGGIVFLRHDRAPEKPPLAPELVRQLNKIAFRSNPIFGGGFKSAEEGDIASRLDDEILKQHIIDEFGSASPSALARRYNVPIAWVYRILKRHCFRGGAE